MQLVVKYFELLSKLIFLFSGRKTGKGIFIYDSNSKDRPLNSEAEEILKKYHIPPKVE